MTAVDAVRILHLFANFKWTGPADPAIRTAVRLRQLGLDVVFAQAGHTLPRTEHRIAAELAARSVPVVTGLQLRKHFHLPSLAADLAALRALLLRDRYQLVHCHLPADHLLAALACRRLAQPPLLVRTVYEPEAPRLGVRMRYAFRRTAGVVVPTERARQGLVGRCGLDQDRVLRLEPVTEPQRLDGPDQRARWGLGPEQLVVGITARIQPHRRFDLLWDVASRVTAQLPNARFVLLGRGNEVDTRALVTEPIAKRGLQPFVVLPGYQRGSDYHSALRSLDAFLFLVPGSDGTCRAVADAMAFGLPVVATDRGILPELLATRRPGEVPGVTCQEDAATLAAALLELLRDAGLRRNRGAAALRRAQLDMDPERAARALRTFYQQLLDRREVPR